MVLLTDKMESCYCLFNRLRRRSVCLIWLILAMLLPVAVTAGDHAATIKIISHSDAEPYQQTIDSFKSSLLKDHPNIEFTSPQNNKKSTDKPDLVFALGSDAVRQAINNHSDTNLLATIIINQKVLQGSKHATAILLDNPIQKQLEWHRRILPEAKSIGVLFDPENNQRWVNSATEIARRMGLEIFAIPVTSAKDLPVALDLLGRYADSILGITDRTVYSGKTARSVLLFSFRNRLPFVGLSRAWVKAGALYALDWDYTQLGQQNAAIASRILKGAQANEVKIRYPQQNLYVLNLKTARHMKLELSRELIDGAAEVYR